MIRRAARALAPARPADGRLRPSARARARSPASASPAGSSRDSPSPPAGPWCRCPRSSRSPSSPTRAASIAALDARMGEAYVAAYARNGDDWDEVIAPRLADAPVAAAAAGPRWAATGSGFDRHPWLRDALSRIGRDALRGRPAARRRGRAASPRGASRAARGMPPSGPRPYTCATRWPSRPRKGEAKR